MSTDNRASEPRRLKSCVEAWPECETGEYNPSCCRFPKSCSATVYSEEHVTEDDLEPPAALVAAQGAAPQAESAWIAGYGGTGVNKASQVLPSSGVDEEKLAEVIGSLDWGYMVDGPSVSEIARAVAEWLKGQK